MAKNKKISVKGTEITILTQKTVEFISLTDKWTHRKMDYQ